jgi:hypothetical protein
MNTVPVNSPDQKSAINVLRQAVDLTRRVGAMKEARKLEVFHARFQAEPPTFKQMRGELDDAMNEAAIRIRELLLDERRNPHPGMKPLFKEHEHIWLSLSKLAYPPEWSEMDISGFAGSEQVKEKTLNYKGDPNGVRPVVEPSIALVRRYSRLIGAGDFKAAYGLTDSGLRGEMDFKKFVVEHERAAEKFRGPALEFRINQFAYVYADAAARKESNTAREGWHKLTARENRRGRVLGFWIRDRAAKTGSGGALWIAEENKDYRVAKFDFWRP